GARHVERDVGFEQGAPHFAQRGIDVRLGQRAAARQAIENAAEPFGERIEHRAVVLRPHPSRRALWALLGMRAYQTPMARAGALRCGAVPPAPPGGPGGCISALGESARNLGMRRPGVKNADETATRKAKPRSSPRKREPRA